MSKARLPASADIIYPLAGRRVMVAGHRGMVGAALLRRLAREDCEIITAPRTELDLTRQNQVDNWIERHRPDTIFVAAAKVGGILANDTFPADFLYNNLMIQANIVHAAHHAGVRKVLLLGSSCIYPRMAPQPISEDALLTGPLEPTNEAYAIAKITGIKLGQAYRRQHGLDVISAMPTNLYGPGDNFDLTSSHVMPALIRKAHAAKRDGTPTFTIWGSGAPLREFLHVDDCADALVHLMQVYSGPEHINVGSGRDLSILELAQHVAEAVGFTGGIDCDRTKPDGTPRKLMSNDRLKALGWTPRTPLRDGIASVYRWFLEHEATIDAASPRVHAQP